jgi:hypothetical protein
MKVILCLKKNNKNKKRTGERSRSNWYNGIVFNGLLTVPGSGSFPDRKKLPGQDEPDPKQDQENSPAFPDNARVREQPVRDRPVKKGEEDKREEDPH